MPRGALLVLAVSAGIFASQQCVGVIAPPVGGPAGPVVEVAANALAATAISGVAPLPTRTPPAVRDPEPLEVQPDGSSVDAIVTALYASVSHGPEYETDWKRLRALFLPGAIVVPPRRPDADSLTVLDLDGFETRIRRYFAGRRERGESLALLEREIGRRELRFGRVCQVFSAYETLRSKSDAAPFSRGVHGIQLVSDGIRWWIAALVWDNERPDDPIPPDLLAR